MTFVHPPSFDPLTLLFFACCAIGAIGAVMVLWFED